MLTLFKSGRRLEYLEENLKVLSAERGTWLSTTYGAHWVSPDLLDAPPVPGERALIVLTGRPYDVFVAVRFARILEARLVDERLELAYEVLGRAEVADRVAWRRYVLAEENPSPASQVFARRDPGTESVDLPAYEASPEGDEQAWMLAVDSLSKLADYSNAVFMRLAGVVDDASEVEIPGPWVLRPGTTYRLRLQSYNPHLDEESIRGVWLAEDHHGASVVVLNEEACPAQGVVEVLLEPSEADSGYVEVSSRRESDFMFGARIEWTTPAHAAQGRQHHANLVMAAESTAASVEVRPMGAALSIAPAPMSPPRRPASWAAEDKRYHAEIAEGAFRRVRDAAPLALDMQLHLIDDLLGLVGVAPRLIEWRGIVQYEVGQYDAAIATLSGLPGGPVTRRGRTALVAAPMRSGRTPDPLEAIRLADFSSDDSYSELLDACLHLEPEGALAVSCFAVERLLTEDRAARWLETMVNRPDVSKDGLRTLLRTWWQLGDPSRAASALAQLLDTGRLGLEDSRTADLTFELGCASGQASMASQALRQLVLDARQSRAVDRLEELLVLCVERLDPPQRHRLGEEIMRLLADLAPESRPIDSALSVAADFVEDYRQQGELDRGSKLAEFIIANRHRSSDLVSLRVDEVVRDLSRAVSESEVFLQYRQLILGEEEGALRDAVGGRCLLVVGGSIPDWWPDVRDRLGLDGRSDWVGSEYEQRIKLKPVEARIKSGVVAAVVMMRYIGHDRSDPIRAAAADRGIPVLRCDEVSEGSFLAALRGCFVPRGRAAEPTSRPRG